MLFFLVSYLEDRFLLPLRVDGAGYNRREFVCMPDPCAVPVLGRKLNGPLRRQLRYCHLSFLP